MSAAAARSTALALAQALEREGFSGWDPYDALAAPLVRGVARTRFARGAAIQALKRSPVNARTLLGVPRLEHTKGLALAASAYAALARVPWGAEYRDRAVALADRLAHRGLPVGGGLGFGYDFDVQTRWGYYRRGQPNAVATAFSAHALLDAAALDPARGFDELARAAASFARSSLFVELDGEGFFAYFPGSRVPVHNASLLLAGVAARCADRTSPERQAAAEAVAYSLARQRLDGSWPYAEGARLDWVDGSHTAYVLDSLGRWVVHTRDAAAGRALARGLDFYLTRLIDSDGAPRATTRSRFPIDIHAAAVGVATLSALAGNDPRALPAADRMLAWTLRSMRRRDGRFAFRRHRLFRNGTAYVRWNDAHMLRALAAYLVAQEERRAA